MINGTSALSLTNTEQLNNYDAITATFWSDAQYLEIINELIRYGCERIYERKR